MAWRWRTRAAWAAGPRPSGGATTAAATGEPAKSSEANHSSRTSQSDSRANPDGCRRPAVSMANQAIQRSLDRSRSAAARSLLVMALALSHADGANRTLRTILYIRANRSSVYVNITSYS